MKNKKNNIKTFMLEEHIEGCISVKAVLEGVWNSCWVSEKTMWLRIPGRRGRPITHPCMIFRCNMIKCPAELAVLEEDLLKLLPKV